MNFYKKISFSIAILLFLSIILFPPKIAAQTPTPTPVDPVCYSQCAAYKFFWKGDFCWDLLQANCSMGKGGLLFNVVKFLFNIWRGGKGVLDVSAPLRATFFCAPLIEDCIVPKLHMCDYMCRQDPTFYAPDLTVTRSWLGSNYPGLRYNDSKKQLTISVMNDGFGHAMAIEVEVTWGSTKNRNKIVSGGGSLIKGVIPQLRFHSANQNGKNTPQKEITDWIIAQSNLSGFFPPDPTINEIPFFWEKTISFSAPDNEFTKVTVNVDPSNLIREGTEDNNTYTLTIDKLPTPHKFVIENFKLERKPDWLNQYIAVFDLKNVGEENGNAQIQWYDQKYSDGLTAFIGETRTIFAKSQQTITQDLTVDVSNGSFSCATSKKMAVTVADADGVQIVYEFSVPLYAGSASGIVKDLLGKPVAGATVTALTGQTAQTDQAGYYHLRGINQLGPVQIIATHPDFSQRAEQTIDLTFQLDPKYGCEAKGLQHNLDFILKDEDVLFTVTVKDGSGNLLPAHILAVNPDFRLETDVNGSGPLTAMQPGKYLFTISSPGYKTIRQDVNAVPRNCNLLFVLEKLTGRPDDSGLRLITPRLLWKKTLGSGEKIIGNLTGTKNGKLLVVSVGDNKAKTRQLFFLDFLTGQQIKEVSVPYSVEEQRFVGLDASYDGGTVGLFVNPGTSINKREGVVKLFDAAGNQIGTTTLDSKLAISMDVSPDGFYVCPYWLLDKGLHQYTRHETEGEGDDDFRRNPAVCADYFLRNNHRVTSCKEGLCEKTIANKQLRVIGNIGETSAANRYDSTFDDKTVVVRTYKKLYYFGNSSWSKELESDNRYQSVAVSPGGMYTLVTTGSGGDTGLSLKIFGNNGGDKTPQFPYKDVRFVFANDKGLFFASIVSNRLSLYQVGEYASEYKPEAVSPTAVPDLTYGLSYLGWAQQFFPAGGQTFASLDPGVVYRADVNIQLKIIPPFSQTSLGTLSITKDTLFSVDNHHNPVLLRGQMTANFGSPATIYAIKFDSNLLSLFQRKLNLFISRQLPESEYFEIKNIHTKFVVKNKSNQINIAVDMGEVRVTGKNFDRSIKGGKQIAIDGKNNIKESIYLGTKMQLVIVGILIFVVGMLLFKYRHTPAGKKTLLILKIIVVWLYKTIVWVVRLILLLVKKLALLIWEMIKKLIKKK